MNQPYTKEVNNSNRFSSRKPIFDGKSSIRKERGQEDGELYRIVAKIRQLEDDVRLTFEQNQQIQNDNQYLGHQMGEYQHEASYEEGKLQALNDQISRVPVGEDPFGRYQEELRGLADKIEQMHEDINDKNRTYQKLRLQKQGLLLSHLKQKQEWNVLQFQQNTLTQKLNELLDHTNHKDTNHSTSTSTKVKIIIDMCKQLQQQITVRSSKVQGNKRKFQEDFMVERKKRMEKEYEVRLIQERIQDYEKKKDFLKSCYNQESIQGVIDDMLAKEHALRQQIDIQLQKIDISKEQSQEALNTCERKISRQRSYLLQELKVQRIQNDMASSQRQQILNDLSNIEQSLGEMQEQGAQIAIQNRVSDTQNYTKISQLQTQNIALQHEYTQLLTSIELLRFQITN